MTYLRLVELARTALENSYAPYSKFRVGAALFTNTNKVYLGCNIENASYSSTVCAERVAFYKALSKGEKKFKMLALVGCNEKGEYKRFCYPCGACLQVMSEFCKPNFEIILGDDTIDFEVTALEDFLPHKFEF